MTIPTVHLNGTSKDTLLDDLTAARSAVLDAITAVKLTAPNGRDYYPQGPDALRQAEQEHKGRIACLQRVASELMELAIAVDRAAS